MAQTIAMQRGSGSVVSGNNLTLFTQSGGSATRVIFNMLTFYGVDGQLSYSSVNLLHVGSNGVPNIIGYLKNGTSRWSFQFNPANNAYGPAQAGGNTGSQFMSGYINANNGAGYAGSWPANQMDVQAPASSYQGYMPSNFWIGPSDSIVFSPFDGNTRTIQVGWSFTTITES